MAAASSTWLDALPPDFYEHLAHCLSLHGMACAELLGFAEVQALLVDTGFGPATVQQLNAIQTQPALLEALRTQPLAVYELLVLGRAALDTSLALPVLAYLQRQMQIGPEELASLKTYCLELGAAFMDTLETNVAPPPPYPSLGFYRLRLEEQLNALLAGQPASSPPVANLRLNVPQLQMLRLALLLVHSLPQAADHAFLRAVARLPHLSPAALEPLIERLGRVHAQEQLPLSMPELVQLYQGMQVCGMVFVSDVMSQLGLEDAFPVLSDAETEAAEAAPASNRQAVGEMVSGFTHWVQQTFPDDETIRQARTEVLALADSL